MVNGDPSYISMYDFNKYLRKNAGKGMLSRSFTVKLSSYNFGNAIRLSDRDGNSSRVRLKDS